jgi:glycosyltransferase involved in cell wall biosynthesis
VAKILVIASLAESLTRFRGQLLRAFLKAGLTVVTCAPNSDEATIKELKDLGIAFHPYTLNRAGMNPLKDMQTVVSLRGLIKEIKPDYTLSYTVKPVIYGSYAARLAGVPNIYTMISGLGYAFGGNTLKQRLVGVLVSQLYRTSLGVNKAVFFQNPDDMNLFIERGLVKKERAVLINGSGVELDKFAVAPLPPAPPSFLLIARLIAEKGIREYVQAAEILRQKYPDVRFRLLGPLDPNPAAIQMDEIQSWVDKGIIDYRGETTDVRPFLAETSVYVLPSFYREGTPRSVLEAMSMGRPVITSDAPGCRETVINGENGFLVPVKDVPALVKAMETFIQQPDLIPTMGKRSREIAEAKYDVHKVNDVILDTLQIRHSADTARHSADTII